jgi:hypothetical protein
MTNEEHVDYGVLQFFKYRTFVEPDAALGREEVTERRMRRYDWDAPPLAPGVAGWPRVQTAILRGGMFRIEARSPEFTYLMLSFCPEKPDAGKYEIQRGRYEEVERGHTVKLIEVPDNETELSVAMLSRFKVRYFIKTERDTPSRTCLVWLVGLNTFRPVPVEEEEA